MGEMALLSKAFYLYSDLFESLRVFLSSQLTPPELWLVGHGTCVVVAGVSRAPNRHAPQNLSSGNHSRRRRGGGGPLASALVMLFDSKMLDSVKHTTASGPLEYTVNPYAHKRLPHIYAWYPDFYLFRW